MKNLIISVLLALSLVGSGFVIKQKNDQVASLNARIEEVEASNIADREHFTRELQRQAWLRQLGTNLKDLNDASEKDTSGADFLFSADRLQRIQSIR